MKHTIAISADGSSTLKLTEFDELYHSSNGAFNEAKHIYIKNGINTLYNKIEDSKLPKNSKEISQNSKEESQISNQERCIIVYDIGLGTALNAILTLLWQLDLPNPPKIKYIGIEKYPIPFNEIEQLNYPQYIANEREREGHSNLSYSLIDKLYKKIHNSEWNREIEIAPNFTLQKVLGDITNFIPDRINNCKSVIYYDTFSPATQPQLWDKEIFKRFYNVIEKDSILITYCSKGTVKQALRESGFIVKRLEGPLGKRHIVQATKD